MWWGKLALTHARARAHVYVTEVKGEHDAFSRHLVEGKHDQWSKGRGERDTMPNEGKDRAQGVVRVDERRRERDGAGRARVG